MRNFNTLYFIQIPQIRSKHPDGPTVFYCTESRALAFRLDKLYGATKTMPRHLYNLWENIDI